MKRIEEERRERMKLQKKLEENWAMLRWLSGYIENNQEQWERERRERESERENLLKEWEKSLRFEKIWKIRQKESEKRENGEIEKLKLTIEAPTSLHPNGLKISTKIRKTDKEEKKNKDAIKEKRLEMLYLDTQERLQTTKTKPKNKTSVKNLASQSDIRNWTQRVPEYKKFEKTEKGPEKIEKLRKIFEKNEDNENKIRKEKKGEKMIKITEKTNKNFDKKWGGKEVEKFGQKIQAKMKISEKPTKNFDKKWGGEEGEKFEKKFGQKIQEKVKVFEKGVKRKRIEELENKPETRKIQKLILELNHKSHNEALNSDEMKRTEDLRNTEIAGNLDHSMK